MVERIRMFIHQAGPQALVQYTHLYDCICAKGELEKTTVVLNGRRFAFEVQFSKLKELVISKNNNYSRDFRLFPLNPNDFKDMSVMDIFSISPEPSSRPPYPAPTNTNVANVANVATTAFTSGSDSFRRRGSSSTGSLASIPFSSSEILYEPDLSIPTLSSSGHMNMNMNMNSNNSSPGDEMQSPFSSDNNRALVDLEIDTLSSSLPITPNTTSIVNSTNSTNPAGLIKQEEEQQEQQEDDSITEDSSPLSSQSITRSSIYSTSISPVTPAHDGGMRSRVDSMHSFREFDESTESTNHQRRKDNGTSQRKEGFLSSNHRDYLNRSAFSSYSPYPSLSTTSNYSFHQGMRRRDPFGEIQGQSSFQDPTLSSFPRPSRPSLFTTNTTHTTLLPTDSSGRFPRNELSSNYITPSGYCNYRYYVNNSANLDFSNHLPESSEFSGFGHRRGSSNSSSNSSSSNNLRRLDLSLEQSHDLTAYPPIQRRDSEFSALSGQSLRADRADRMDCRTRNEEEEEEWSFHPAPSTTLCGEQWMGGSRGGLRMGGAQVARGLKQRTRKWVLTGFRHQMPISDLVDFLYGIDIQNAEYEMKYDGNYMVVIYGSSEWSDDLLMSYLRSNPVDGQLICLHSPSEELALY